MPCITNQCFAYKSIDNINLYFFTNKKDYSNIMTYLNSLSSSTLVHARNELNHELLDSLTSINNNNYFILASKSKYNENIKKIKSIISTF